MVMLSACAGSGAATPTQGAPSAVTADAPRQATPAPAARPNDPGAPSAEKAPAVSLAGELIEQAAVQDSVEPSVQLVLQNRDAAPVSLASEVAVERAGDAGFAPFAEHALSLRFACNAPAATCIEFVSGAELRPPAWLATAGRAQCAEREGAPAPPGRYRFVARTCDGARIEGTPFTLPP